MLGNDCLLSILRMDKTQFFSITGPVLDNQHLACDKTFSNPFDFYSAGRVARISLRRRSKFIPPLDEGE